MAPKIGKTENIAMPRRSSRRESKSTRKQRSIFDPNAEQLLPELTNSKQKLKTSQKIGHIGKDVCSQEEPEKDMNVPQERYIIAHEKGSYFEECDPKSDTMATKENGIRRLFPRGTLFHNLGQRRGCHLLVKLENNLVGWLDEYNAQTGSLLVRRWTDEEDRISGLDDQRPLNDMARDRGFLAELAKPSQKLNVNHTYHTLFKETPVYGEEPLYYNGNKNGTVGKRVIALLLKRARIVFLKKGNRGPWWSYFEIVDGQFQGMRGWLLVRNLRGKWIIEHADVDHMSAASDVSDIARGYLLEDDNSKESDFEMGDISDNGSYDDTDTSVSSDSERRPTNILDTVYGDKKMQTFDRGDVETLQLWSDFADPAGRDVFPSFPIQQRMQQDLYAIEDALREERLKKREEKAKERELLIENMLEERETPEEVQAAQLLKKQEVEEQKIFRSFIKQHVKNAKLNPISRYQNYEEEVNQMMAEQADHHFSDVDSQDSAFRSNIDLAEAQEFRNVLWNPLNKKEQEAILNGTMEIASTPVVPKILPSEAKRNFLVEKDRIGKILTKDDVRQARNKAKSLHRAKKKEQREETHHLFKKVARKRAERKKTEAKLAIEQAKELQKENCLTGKQALALRQKNQDKVIGGAFNHAHQDHVDKKKGLSGKITEDRKQANKKYKEQYCDKESISSDTEPENHSEPIFEVEETESSSEDDGRHIETLDDINACDQGLFVGFPTFTDNTKGVGKMVQFNLEETEIEKQIRERVQAQERFLDTNVNDPEDQLLQRITELPVTQPVQVVKKKEKKGKKRKKQNETKEEPKEDIVSKEGNNEGTDQKKSQSSKKESENQSRLHDRLLREHLLVREKPRGATMFQVDLTNHIATMDPIDAKKNVQNQNNVSFSTMGTAVPRIDDFFPSKQEHTSRPQHNTLTETRQYAHHNVQIIDKPSGIKNIRRRSSISFLSVTSSHDECPVVQKDRVRADQSVSFTRSDMMENEYVSAVISGDTVLRLPSRTRLNQKSQSSNDERVGTNKSTNCAETQKERPSTGQKLKAPSKSKEESRLSHNSFLQRSFSFLKSRKDQKSTCMVTETPIRTKSIEQRPSRERTDEKSGTEQPSRTSQKLKSVTFFGTEKPKTEHVTLPEDAEISFSHSKNGLGQTSLKMESQSIAMPEKVMDASLQASIREERGWSSLHHKETSVHSITDTTRESTGHFTRDSVSLQNGNFGHKSVVYPTLPRINPATKSLACPPTGEKQKIREPSHESSQSSGCQSPHSRLEKKQKIAEPSHESSQSSGCASLRSRSARTFSSSSSSRLSSDSDGSIKIQEEHDSIPTPSKKLFAQRRFELEKLQRKFELEKLNPQKKIRLQNLGQFPLKSLQNEDPSTRTPCSDGLTSAHLTTTTFYSHVPTKSSQQSPPQSPNSADLSILSDIDKSPISKEILPSLSETTQSSYSPVPSSADSRPQSEIIQSALYDRPVSATLPIVQTSYEQHRHQSKVSDQMMYSYERDRPYEQHRYSFHLDTSRSSPMQSFWQDDVFLRTRSLAHITNFTSHPSLPLNEVRRNMYTNKMNVVSSPQSSNKSSCKPHTPPSDIFIRGCQASPRGATFAERPRPLSMRSFLLKEDDVHNKENGRCRSRGGSSQSARQSIISDVGSLWSGPSSQVEVQSFDVCDETLMDKAKALTNQQKSETASLHSTNYGRILSEFSTLGRSGKSQKIGGKFAMFKKLLVRRKQNQKDFSTQK